MLAAPLAPPFAAALRPAAAGVGAGPSSIACSAAPCGTSSIRNASSGASVSASQVSSPPSGPTRVPSVNVALTRTAWRDAVSPLSRTLSPRIGSAMPRLPQYWPASDQGDSQPRPSTAWYSSSAAGTPSGANENPSTQRWLPGSPTHSPARAVMSPRRCTCAEISARTAPVAALPAADACDAAAVGPEAGAPPVSSWIWIFGAGSAAPGRW